jgi:hypothetical protein
VRAIIGGPTCIEPAFSQDDAVRDGAAPEQCALFPAWRTLHALQLLLRLQQPLRSCSCAPSALLLWPLIEK